MLVRNGLQQVLSALQPLFKTCGSLHILKIHPLQQLMQVGSGLGATGQWFRTGDGAERFVH